MKLRYTLEALRQIDQALASIGDRSPRGAIGFRDRLAGAIALVHAHPHAGQSTSSAARRVVLTPYLYVLFYRVMMDEIVATRLRHSSRKPLTAVSRPS